MRVRFNIAIDVEAASKFVALPEEKRGDVEAALKEQLLRLLKRAGRGGASPRGVMALTLDGLVVRTYAVTPVESP